jgi:hypothetical protein
VLDTIVYILVLSESPTDVPIRDISSLTHRPH